MKVRLNHLVHFCESQVTEGFSPEFADCIRMGPSVINLNHFRLLRVVGKGAFGKVRIVERKDTGLTFAGRNQAK
ncbi:hypothetical protein DFH27DRAFT_18358 [Peziza echinospora]|nr:hypothetical protein DFH27DRAFT_18358 [Peziza echinospora]